MNKVMLIYTLQNGTQVPDHTDWHNVLMWRRLAETVERYVHKGDKLYIEGRIRYSSYDNKQGQRQYITEIWADSMEMLSAKPVQPESSSKPEQSGSGDGTEGMPF